MSQVQMTNKHTQDEPKWWQFNTTTWTLIAGLILLNLALFLDVNVVLGYISAIGKVLDVRFWPRWYLPIVLVIFACAVKGIWDYMSWKNSDSDDFDAEKSWAFFVMTATLSLEAITLIVLHATNTLKFFIVNLWIWFHIGTYSHAAMLFFVLICAFLMAAVYVIRGWLVVVLRPE